MGQAFSHGGGPSDAGDSSWATQEGLDDFHDAEEEERKSTGPTAPPAPSGLVRAETAHWLKATSGPWAQAMSGPWAQGKSASALLRADAAPPVLRSSTTKRADSAPPVLRSSTTKPEAFFEKLGPDSNGLIERVMLGQACFGNSEVQKLAPIGVFKYEDVGKAFDSLPDDDPNAKLSLDMVRMFFAELKRIQVERAVNESVGPDSVGTHALWLSRTYADPSSVKKGDRVINITDEALNYAIGEKNPELLRQAIVVALAKVATHTAEELAVAKRALANQCIKDEAGDLQGLRKITIPKKGVDGQISVDAMAYFEGLVASPQGGCAHEVLQRAIDKEDPEQLKKAIIDAQASLRKVGQSVDDNNLKFAKESLGKLLLDRDLRGVSAKLEKARREGSK